MKAPLSLLLSASLCLIPVFAATAKDKPAENKPATETTVTETKVTAKHQADPDHNTFEELKKKNGGDLDEEHWANDAIQQLIEKYCGIMVGYPDNTFRGQRQMTRFEMAAALYKLMNCLDVQIKTVTIPKPQDVSGLATKEDLKKVQELVKAFKPELDQLMANHLDLAKRITAEEAIQVHGGVELRYRDRVMVTDGTDPSSPLFAKDNSSPTKRVLDGGVVQDRQANETNPLAFSNNINQFVRDQFGLPNQYHSPSAPNVTLDDLAPFRTHGWLTVDARPFDWVSASTQLDMYDIGRASSTLSDQLVVNNGGHDLNEGMPDGSPFVFRRAELNLHTPDKHHQLNIGLFNFTNLLNTGTRFTSLFDQGAWNGRDYGFVGWGGADVALTNTTLAAAGPYRNSLSRYWAGGLGASMVDPDSKKYNQVTAPGIAWRSEWNPNWGTGAIMIGLNGGGAQANREMAAKGNLSSGGAPLLGSQLSFATSNLFGGAVLQGVDRKGQMLGNYLALPSQFGDGYGVIGVEQTFLEKSFPIRISLAAMNYFNDALFDFASPTRKEISGTLDLGWNQNFGATIQVNKSFIGYARHSVGLFFNNIANSNVDVQIGTNLATRGLFNLGDLSSGNAGVAVKFPLVLPQGARKDDLRVIVGVRQAFGDNFGGANTDGALTQLFKDSGITVTVPWKNVWSTPFSLKAQYDALFADALWQFRPVAMDIALIGSYEF